MPGKAPATTVAVDDDVIARARERLDAELGSRVDAEVRSLVQKEPPAMDSEVKAALDAAQKTAKDALDAANQAKTDAAATKVTADASHKMLEQIKAGLDSQAKAAQDAASGRVQEKALKTAKARAILAGQDASKVDAKHPDVVRLAAYGEPALDEMLSLALPGHVADSLHLGGAPKPEPSPDGIEANGLGGFTVMDWGKVPRMADPKANPMGVAR